MKPSRSAAVAVAALAATTIATPALAASKPMLKQTSLTARAAKSTVAPKHGDTLLLTLRSGKALVDTALTNFSVRSRHTTSPSSTATTKWGSWAAVTKVTETSPGHYAFKVVVPNLKKGQKEQYEVKFAGDKTHASSHSQVLSVAVS